jgi:hypothetical protein
LTGAKLFYIENEQGKYIKKPANKDHLKMFLKKLNPLKSFSFTLAVVFYLIMRCVAPFFALFLYFKRSGKKVIFGKEEPVFEEIDGK